MFSDALNVQYSCHSRTRCVVVSFDSSSRSVSVTLHEVFVVVVPKKHGQGTCTSDKLSVVLHTSCARRVRVLIVVALCDVEL